MKRRQFLSSLSGLAALTQTRASRHHLSQRGLTLLELLVVLVILIATALIFTTFNNIDITSPSGESNSPVEIATQATLNTVREAMAGEDGVIESLSHKTNALPREISDLLKEDAPAHMEEAAPELKNYDPVNKIGWHGPYVRATGRNETGELTIVDGWGNELELQVDFDQDGTINQTESVWFQRGLMGRLKLPMTSRT